MTMSKLPTPIKTNQLEPEITTEQATIASLSKDIIELRKGLTDQQKENKNFIFWVVGGVVAILAVVAIEIIIFHTRTDNDYLDLQNQYFQEIKELQKNNSDTELRLQREIDHNSNNIENLEKSQKLQNSK